ncbi:hypothetical protein TCAL_05682 [Tigriopus californicus]|uniref:VASt domain-containing protein n=1 Tax=Tigriopus californicus TaxID=6832 RepID=A0A553PEV2_TIGCA|nr:uncharacterized protein LOC131881421 [Tigriopus californicus]TRY76208.1 hypothetical protein TCAL_05682 [Tigriopus californicus]
MTAFQSFDNRFNMDFPLEPQTPKKKTSQSSEDSVSGKSATTTTTTTTSNNLNNMRRRYSLAAFGKNEPASDSCDSAVQTDPVIEDPVNEEKDSKKKNKNKKHKNSFSKGFFEFMNFTDNFNSNNNIGISSSAPSTSQVPTYKVLPGKVSQDPNLGVGSGSTPSFRASYDILEVDEADDGLQMPPMIAIPKLPKGKKLLDTTVPEDVDSLFKSVFENDTFFEIVGSKAYEEFRHYQCSSWAQGRSTGLLERTMRYEMSKHIAFSRQNVSVEQTQIRQPYCRRGVVYGVDTITINSGVVYSDYFQLNIHYRFVQDEDRPLTHSRLIVVADIEFVKPCLFKGRIESEAWSGMKKYYEIVDKEVQLEKEYIDYRDSNENLTSSNAKLLKDSLNRRILKESHYSAHSGGLLPNQPHMSHEVILLAFFLIILILFMITLAMFKLNTAIGLLDQRLSRIEELLERNGKIFNLILDVDRSNSNNYNDDTIR